MGRASCIGQIWRKHKPDRHQQPGSRAHHKPTIKETPDLQLTFDISVSSSMGMSLGDDFGQKYLEMCGDLNNNPVLFILLYKLWRTLQYSTVCEILLWPHLILFSFLGEITEWGTALSIHSIIHIFHSLRASNCLHSIQAYASIYKL